MTLHEKAKLGALKGESLTTKDLNERDKKGNTVWHIAAGFGTLKDIPQHLFTSTILTKNNKLGDSVWKTAALNNSLSSIPSHLFTEDAFNQKDDDATILHWAAQCWFESIPRHLITKERLETTCYGQTVWHLAAQYRSLNSIPKELFTSEVFMSKDDFGHTVWAMIASNDMIKSVPRHLITNDLLKMKSVFNKSLFTKSDKTYINNILQIPEKLNDFINKNPSLAKDIEFRDPRFVLDEVTDDKLIFSFDGFEAAICLNNDGVLIKKKKFESLNKALLFIEDNCDDIERSLPIPQNNFKLDPFVL